MTAPGCSIVMTGAGSGIGFAALRPLLAADPTVTLITLGRAPAPGDGDARLAPIAAEFPTARLLHLRADLSSLRETDAAAAEIVRRVQSGELPAVGALICNAGVQRVDALTATAEGFEETFAVNVLSVAALIAGLGPALAPDARITVTASDTHFGDLRHNFGLVPAPDWRSARELARPGAFRDPQRVAAGRTAYSTSKTRRHPPRPRAGPHPPGGDPDSCLQSRVRAGDRADPQRRCRLATRGADPDATVDPDTAGVTDIGGGRLACRLCRGRSGRPDRLLRGSRPGGALVAGVL